MRIGEILIAANIIDPRSLQQALDHAIAKGVPVGRSLRAFKFISEEDLTRGLDAQVAIRRGIDGQLCIAVLRSAHHTARNFVDVLRGWPGMTADKMPAEVKALISEKSLEQTRVQVRPDINSETFASAVSRLSDHVGSVMKSGTPPEFAGKTPEALIQEGDNLFAANKCVAAQKAYEMARRDYEEGHGTAPSKMANVLTKLANLYVATEQFYNAEPLLKQLADLHTKVFGHTSPEVARVLEDLADLYSLQLRPTDAFPYLDEALLISEQQAPLDVQVTGRLVRKLFNASKVPNPKERSRIGEIASDAKLISNEHLSQALELSSKSGQPLGIVMRAERWLDTQQVESIMFAQVLINQGTISQPMAVRGIKIVSTHKIPLRQLAEAGQWLAGNDAGDERLKSLVVEQEKLLAAEASLGLDHPEVVTIVERLADIHVARRDRVMCEFLLKRALVSLQKSPDSRKGQLARVSEKLGAAYVQTGKFAEASPVLLKSLEYRIADGQGETPETAKCLWLMAKIEVAQFNHATAIAFFRKAKDLFEALAPNSCPKKLLEEMAGSCVEVGDVNDLEPILSRPAQLAQQEDALSERAADYLEQLGDLYASTGRKPEAQAQYARALQICERGAGAPERQANVSRKLAGVS